MEEQARINVLHLKEIAERQNKELESIVTSFRDFEDSVEKVEKKAKETLNQTDSSLALAKEGIDSIKTLEEKISLLTKAASVASKNMEDLEKMTNMIMGFANVIAGISNKTNMLSLNASIEAARAGEHGRGFAVVANQVNQLAAQSAKASKEISDTIKSIVTFNQSMEKDMNNILEIVESQSTMTGSVTETFGKIIESTESSNEAVKVVEKEANIQKTMTNTAKEKLSKITSTVDQINMELQ